MSTALSLIVTVGGAGVLPAPASDQSVHDRLRSTLGVKEWHDRSTPTRGVIIALHGTTQHATSFDLLARTLTPAGYKVVAFDLRGHGERFHKAESGAPGRKIDYKRSADDLILLCREIRRQHPTIPIFCLGESVGSLVVVRAASQDPQLCQGIILCSAGTRPRVFNPLMVVSDFCKGIVKLDEPMDVTRYIDRYSSDDKRVSDEMIADPLARNQLTPREILRTAGFLNGSAKLAERISPTMSALVIQGAEDGIVSTSSARSVFNKLKTRDKELVVLPTCGHVLLGTSFLKPQVLNSLNTWLASQTAPGRHSLISLDGDEKKQHN